MVSLSEGFEPAILVLSTNLISDPGIDNAGMSHTHYPPRSAVLRFPCSSMIRPDFVLHALTHGFDGVFIAGDGPDCPYLSDCVSRMSKKMNDIQALLKSKGIRPERVSLSGICSVCGDMFSKSMRAMSDRLKNLGPAIAEGGVALEQPNMV